MFLLNYYLLSCALSNKKKKIGQNGGIQVSLSIAFPKTRKIDENLAKHDALRAISNLFNRKSEYYWAKFTARHIFKKKSTPFELSVQLKIVKISSQNVNNNKKKKTRSGRFISNSLGVDRRKRWRACFW